MPKRQNNLELNSGVLLTSVPVENLKAIIKDCFREEFAMFNGDKAPKTDELIKVEDAIKLLKVSKVALYKWRKSGILPFYRISSRIYFKKEEVMKALKQSRLNYNQKQ